MQCLKCGKKTADNQVFCEECLAVMQAYPVKPGIPIQLPQRENRTTEKKALPRKDATSAEQIAQLRATIRWLLITVAVLSVMLLSTAAMLIHTLESNPPNLNIGKSDIGKNYTTTDAATRP